MSTSKVFLNYTDFHDVDEDLRTFTRLGGYWFEESREGITYRYIFNSSSYAADDVASSDIQNIKLHGLA